MEMTEVALRLLGRNSQGFYLFVRGSSSTTAITRAKLT